MAYVFGISGVPVFEMLFVLMVLLLVGLIFVLYEIRRLKSLISQEKVDIGRFENDLSKFESKQGKSPTPGLLNVVKNARDGGMSPAEIHSSMTSAGWKSKDVKGILSRI